MDKLISTSSATSVVAKREQFFNSPAVPAKPAATQQQLGMNASSTFGEKVANGLANGETHRSISPIVSNHTSTPISGTPAPPLALSGKDALRHPHGKHSSTTIKEMHGYVGFANIPNQVYRKAVKRGFEFTLMVVGQSGLGKSTFVNSLFLSDVCTPGKSARLSTTSKTTRIEETTVRLVENGVMLTLTLIDTPGFGDAVDNSNCWDPITQHIDKKFMDFFNEETKIHRKERIPDHRVHCCLYFIAPTGHGLKPLDVEFMKHLHERVNIIPVIAKADTLTSEELSYFKQRINRELEEHGIRIYDFPDIDEENGEPKEHKRLKQRIPFAVVGSNYIMDSGGKQIRCRKYPWGIVEVENLEHSDFVTLRNMIIRKHMIDLIEVTRCVHYENFRCNQLCIGDSPDATGNKHPFTTMDEEKRQYEMKLKNERDQMEKVLEEKVKAKLSQYVKMGDELDVKQRNYETILEDERKKVAALKESLEQDRQVFKQQYPDFHKYTSSESLKKEKKKKGVF